MQSIVEGHGEVLALPPLVRRICSELFSLYHVEVAQPLRQPRTRLVRDGELQRFAGVAANKLRAARPVAHGLVLVLLDGDGDRPCELGPRLLARAQSGSGDQAAACVVANLEFETWFVAAAESLGDYLDLGASQIPQSPETLRLRKKWIEDRFRGTRYSETLDQPRLAARMDLALCRSRSPSFDKLCRDLERAIATMRTRTSGHE
ncbi:DUF4276 family protein [Nannocystis pusilla]|uniref:DUF4276 family protein n=1 Tax=Nannocystis pusilla TaxID=889268 RepID=A0A9X3F3E1_9BACT|nr:DUF4276 family protein [Nannocystis pusilla]